MEYAAIIMLIVIGALASRSATFIYGQIRGGFAARLALAFARDPARFFLQFYVLAGLPLAFLNGYLLQRSWIDCLLVGIGTWIGMLASIALARQFNPVLQFYLFASVSLVSLIVDVCRLFLPGD